MTIRAASRWERSGVRDKAGLLPDGPENTVYRAIMLLKESFHGPRAWRFVIEKHIPVGSGLGGGSSERGDGDESAGPPLGPARAVRRAHGLRQADRQPTCPFFSTGPCVIRGVGERVSPIELPRLSYVIVYPNVVISTERCITG